MKKKYVITALVVVAIAIFWIFGVNKLNIGSRVANVFMICVLGVSIVVMCVYYFWYKASLNKRLEEEISGERKEHISMPTLGTVAKVIVIIVCFNYFTSLNNTLENMKDDIVTLCEDMNTDSLRRYDELKMMIKKQDEQISKVDLKYGKYNKDNHTAELTLDIVLKEYSKNTKMKANVYGHTVELYEDEKSAGVFSGSFVMDIFEDVSEYPYITYVIENDGVKKTGDTQDIYELSYVNIVDFYLASPDVAIYGSGDYFNGKMDIEMSGSAGIYDSEEFQNKITKITFKVKKNDEVIEEEVLCDVSQNKYKSELDFDKSYDAEENDKFIVYIEADDNMGYKHISYLYEFEGNNVAAYVESYDIYDEEGNSLYAY